MSSKAIVEKHLAHQWERWTLHVDMTYQVGCYFFAPKLFYLLTPMQTNVEDIPLLMIGIHVHEQYVPVACALANKEINQIFEFVFQVITALLLLRFCTKKFYVSVD